MPLYSQFATYIKQDEGAAIAMIVRGPEQLLGMKALVPLYDTPTGPLLNTELKDYTTETALQLIPEGKSVTREYTLTTGETVEIFFDVHRPSPRLVIVGAVHIASDLIHYSKPLGFRTYLVDPRTAFATRERFPNVDEMIAQWPDEALPDIGLNRETNVVVITHDPKLDDPALKIALPSPARYVGALGSKKTHAQRVERLLSEGMPQEHLDRLHAPIGLDIGGRTPAEIALSIIAEIVAVHNDRPVGHT